VAKLADNILLPFGFRLLLKGERIHAGDLHLANPSWDADWIWRALPKNDPVVGLRFNPDFHDAVARDWR